MKIALYGQASGPDIADPVGEILDELQDYGADLAVEAEFAKGLDLGENTPHFTLEAGLQGKVDRKSGSAGMRRPWEYLVCRLLLEKI